MKEYFNADPAMSNPAHNIIGEVHEYIVAGTPVKLNHDVFYGDGLVIYKIVEDEPVELEIETDYILSGDDSIATQVSGRNCYQEILFNDSHEKITVDYWAYGDFFSAEGVNEIVSGIDGIKEAVGGSGGLAENINGIKEIIGGDNEEGSLVENITAIKEKVNTLDSIVEDIAEIKEKVTALDGVAEDISGLGEAVSALVEDVAGIKESINESMEEIIGGINNALTVINGGFVQEANDIIDEILEDRPLENEDGGEPV
jgi:molybdopterin converting factor small subunit